MDGFCAESVGCGDDVDCGVACAYAGYSAADFYFCEIARFGSFDEFKGL